MNGIWANFAIDKGEQGVWSVTYEPLKSSMYPYNFFIDGVAANDPTLSQALRDGNRYASLFIVPGKESDVYPPNDTPHGNISQAWYDSPSLGTIEECV